MATTQYDNSYDANDYFFVSGIDNCTFRAGRNSFVINQSAKVKETMTTSNIAVYDPNGSRLNVYNLIPAASTIQSNREGSARAFGVLVYPNTPTGVGRIEIVAKALNSETTNAPGLKDDQRFPSGVYSNNGSAITNQVVWAKAVYFAPQTHNTSDARFFTFPELHASTEVYDIHVRNGCPATVTGTCHTDAVTPKHGDLADVDYQTTDVRYVLTKVSGPMFDSAMVGALVRLTDVNVSMQSYIGTNGSKKAFDGTITTDLIGKVRSVLNANTLLLDRPLIVSNAILDGATSEASPYLEDNGTDIKRFDPFNETDLYAITANSSGVQQTQTNQVYNNGFLGNGHRKNFYVIGIRSATFTITYLPRTTSWSPSGLSYVDGNQAEFSKRVCMAKLSLSNLRTTTGATERFRVYQRSLNIPESQRCIAEGYLKPRELLFDWTVGEDVSWLGKFYDQSFANTYWLSRGVTIMHSPGMLMDSATISEAGSNASEENYIILKTNRSEPARTNQYVQSVPQNGSWFGTTQQTFTNFSVEPTTNYECAAGSPYLSSIEVAKSGPIYNSNFIKLAKNTMYELSFDYTSLIQMSDTYEFIVYFMTTYNGRTDKVRLGLLNSRTTRGFKSGHYSGKVFVGRTMYGTIQLVPKNLISVAVANISLKQFGDASYPMDSAELIVPLDVRVKNERFEITVELIGNDGKVLYGESSNAFGNNKSLIPLREVVVADPQWLTLPAFDKS
jgi:hypothetical protein